MITFKEFLFEEVGTYISARFDDKTNELLKEYTKELGLNPIDNFHITICYSKKNLDIPFGTNKIQGKAKAIGIQYLGDEDSEYRAIVLKLDSDIIQERFNYYVEQYNYKHHYDSFIPHVSLAYKPKEGIDLKKINVPNFELNIVDEVIKELKED